MTQSSSNSSLTLIGTIVQAAEFVWPNRAVFIYKGPLTAIIVIRPAVTMTPTETPVLSSFIKSVFRTICTNLAVLGFEQQKPGLLVVRINEDILGWLGLNKAVRGQVGVLEINPVVGVRSRPIEKLVAELCGEPFDELVPATLAGNIGYMTPANKYRPYNFSETSPPDTVADELVDDVSQYGLSFIRNHTEMAALVKGLRSSRFAIQFMADYRIPAGLSLLDQLGEAEAYVKAKLADLAGRQDPAALRYKVFAGKFLEYAGKKASLKT